MATFGKRLKLLREEKELSQQELAKFFNLSQSTIAYYELDKKQPSQKTLRGLAEFFGCTVDYLLGRTDIRNLQDKFTDALKNNSELLDFWKEICQREDLQLLFKQARGLKPDTIRKVVEVIKLIEDTEAGQ